MAALQESDVDAETTLGSGLLPGPLSRRRTLLLVAIGGALGAGVRFALSVVLPTTATPTLVEMPWSTLMANVLGCLTLGVLAGVLEVRPVPAWTRPLLGTGFCGGFTTLSALILEGSAMVGADFPMLATGYALLTLVTCIGSLVVGMMLAMRLARPPLRAVSRTPAAGA